jgi:hypothetical protein
MAADAANVLYAKHYISDKTYGANKKLRRANEAALQL